MNPKAQAYPRRSSAAILIPILLAALWLYLPFIRSGMPYFYDEDEAHHFNRVVNMVKEGTYNPHYFHKPSLHFYLRLPAVAAAYLKLAKKGEIASVQDIRTKDEYGLADYAFTASHPAIVKWNRGLSVLFTLGMALLAFVITIEFGAGSAAAAGAALLTALSPALTAHSAVIAVDTPMSLLCLLCAYLALRLQRSFSFAGFVACGVTAGLAISTKYNAAPIALVPLLAALAAGRRAPGAIATALVTPCAGFILGSPYALLSLPTLLDHMGYEMWHYRSGHAGHMAEPGLPQAIFYAKWLLTEGLGVLPVLAAAAGVLIMLRDSARRAVVLFAFPAIFAALMIAQRTNFTRNMLVVIPFAAIAAGMALERGIRLLPSFKGRSAVLVLAAAAVLYQPAIGAWRTRAAAAAVHDSRDDLFSWLRQQDQGTQTWIETAVSGRLQLPPFTATADRQTVFSPRNAVRIDPTMPLPALYQAGFDRLVVGPERRLTAEEQRVLDLEHNFPGEGTAQRIVQNPEIKVYRFTPAARDYVRERLGSALPAVSLDSGTDREPHVWLQHRLSMLHISDLGHNNGDSVPLDLEVMSPWPAQVITFRAPGSGWRQECLTPPGTGWAKCRLTIPREVSKTETLLEVEIAHLHTPRNRGISEDQRRLGAALRRSKAGS